MKTTTMQQISGSKRGQTVPSGPLLKTKDPLLGKIITYLRLHHHLNAAFLISKQIDSTENHIHFPQTKSAPVRHFTYTLFIITDKLPHTMKPHNPAQLMDEVYNHTEKQARVYLISYTATAVADKVGYGNNFLVSIFSAAPCVYSVDDWWMRFKSYKINRHPVIVERISDHWKTRFNRATYLHNLTVYSESDQDPAAYFEVLQRVLQQTCLGLIYVFWEYKPSYTSLPYLLHLCGHFSDFPSKVFNTNTCQNHHIVEHLCHASHIMKFRVQTGITQKHIDKAWQRCNDFLEKAHSLATQRLKVLQQESREHILKVSGKG